MDLTRMSWFSCLNLKYYKYYLVPVWGSILISLDLTQYFAHKHGDVICIPTDSFPLFYWLILGGSSVAGNTAMCRQKTWRARVASKHGYKQCKFENPETPCCQCFMRKEMNSTVLVRNTEHKLYCVVCFSYKIPREAWIVKFWIMPCIANLSSADWKNHLSFHLYPHIHPSVLTLPVEPLPGAPP